MNYLMKLVDGELVPLSEAELGQRAIDVAASTIDLTAYVADARWRREIAGISVTLSTGEIVPVSTERGDVRANLHTEYTAIRDGLRSDGDVFNLADGIPRALSNADMMLVITRARGHVRSCFNAQPVVAARVATGELTSPAQVDAAFAAI